MKKTRIQTTLLDLIQRVQDYARNDDEVVAVITHMINAGRVVLAGNFAGQRIAVRRAG
jgi:hypothetical protein